MRVESDIKNFKLPKDVILEVLGDWDIIMKGIPEEDKVDVTVKDDDRLVVKMGLITVADIRRVEKTDSKVVFSADIKGFKELYVFIQLAEDGEDSCNIKITLDYEISFAGRMMGLDKEFSHETVKTSLEDLLEKLREGIDNFALKAKEEVENA